MNYRPSALVLRNGRLVRRYRDEPKTYDPSPPMEIADDEEPKIRVARKILLSLFLLTLFLPLSYDIGTVRITPYTGVLILAFFPLLFKWLGQKNSPVIAPDILMLLYCIWSGIALIYNHGLDATFQTIGIQVLECFGAYLMGRVLVRDVPSMRLMTTVMILALGAMFPFVVMESLTGKKVIIDIFSALGDTPKQMAMDKRFGLTRAQGAFEHPILMGVVTASIMSIAFYIWQGKGNILLRWLSVPISVASSILSLSTGALLTLNVQIGLMAWERIFRDNVHRWRLLIGLLVSMYVAVDMISTRTPFHVFVSYAAFSQNSSYNRILIWQYGSADALAHPIFGIGLADWNRPGWMSGSIDNFWLVQALHYGIPAFLMIASALLIIILRVSAAQMPTKPLAEIRKGMVFSLIAFAFSIFSVHLWHASYVWFCFLMGACVWPMFVSGKGQGVADTGAAPAIADAVSRPSRPSGRAPLVRKGR